MNNQSLIECNVVLCPLFSILLCPSDVSSSIQIQRKGNAVHFIFILLLWFRHRMCPLGQIKSQDGHSMNRFKKLWVMNLFLIQLGWKLHWLRTLCFAITIYMVNYAHAGKTQKGVKLSPLHSTTTCNKKGKLWTQTQLISLWNSSNWLEIGWVELGANRELNRLRGVWYCFEGHIYNLKNNHGI